MSPPRKQDPIVIVGAGIFGLSTALHLGRRGYQNVTVFDRHDYDEKQYSYQKGCDAASAGFPLTNLSLDLNKIIRSAYGSQTEYQALSLEAIQHWHAWNEEIAAGNTPPDMTSGDKLFHNTGAVSLNSGRVLPPFERDTIRAMTELGRGHTQLTTTDPTQVKHGESLGFNMDPFAAKARGVATVGVLDASSGYVVADKACRFALHKARGHGAKFVFGASSGAFEDHVYRDDEVVGIRTRDGKTHLAKLVIMACGPYTPILVPELDGLAEATAGSVVVFRIPESSPLFAKLAPENFPIWMYNMRAGADGGLYGFSLNAEGLLKIGYRGTKYTNPRVQADGKERSVPVTRYTDGDDEVTGIPTKAMSTIAGFVSENMPEIVEQGHEVAFTRLCWYTDTFDNHFVVDGVPRKKGLMVATGGSGHAFKYLPNIGDWVVDVVEGVGLDRPAVKAWKWRQRGDAGPVNVLMEGAKGPRALRNVTLTSRLDGRA